jgi:hypothetical protein
MIFKGEKVLSAANVQIIGPFLTKKEKGSCSFFPDATHFLYREEPNQPAQNYGMIIP